MRATVTWRAFVKLFALAVLATVITRPHHPAHAAQPLGKVRENGKRAHHEADEHSNQSDTTGFYCFPSRCLLTPNR